MSCCRTPARIRWIAFVSCSARSRARNARISSNAQAERAVATRFTSAVTWGGTILLTVLIVISALIMAREYRAKEAQMWIRAGQFSLSQRIQGEQRLEQLGQHVLSFLAEYLQARVGAVSSPKARGCCAVWPDTRCRKRRAKTFCARATASSARRPWKTACSTWSTYPNNYLPVNSSLGRGKPRELVVAPAATDGIVQAVIEIGLLRNIQPADRELLERVSEALGIAVRASKDRTRLEDLLAETQRQSEELQTQQEELRVGNEELEVQTRALKKIPGAARSPAGRARADERAARRAGADPGAPERQPLAGAARAVESCAREGCAFWCSRSCACSSSFCACWASACYLGFLSAGLLLPLFVA